MQIIHRQTGNRGKFIVPDEEGQPVAQLVYTQQQPDTMIMEHTEVNPELRGQNIGFRLVSAAVEYARQHGKKMLPLCPFVKAVFDKKPDFADVRG